MLSEDYKELKLKIIKKKELISKHVKQLEAMLLKCNHEETEVKEHYYSGEYYNKSYIEYITTCSICGKNISIKTKQLDCYD